MKISVFGIGYIGAVTSACLAESGHEVTAVDILPLKVRVLKEARAPVVEPGLDDLIAKNVRAGRLQASEDHGAAVRESEISLICVGTPGRADGSLNLDYVEAVCRQIGAALKDKSGFHTVVMRSTVLPGTLKGFVKPLLEEASGKKAGVDFVLGSNPEFLRAGSAVADYFEPAKIVVGAWDQDTAARIMSLYDGIEAPRCLCTPAEAEGLKYVSNAWRAAKISFANEMGNILKSHGVDSHRVMDMFFQDTKLNLSKNFMIPGFAFGGSCLPKDVRAMRASANDQGLSTPLLSSLLEANHGQIRRAFGMIEDSGRRSVGLLGLSFKPGTDDLRESPLVTLADMLLVAGYGLKIFDPCLSASKDRDGAGQTYMENHIAHIAAHLVDDPAELAADCDLLVAGKAGPEFMQVIEQADDAVPVVDLVRLGPAFESRGLYAGICW